MLKFGLTFYLLITEEKLKILLAPRMFLLLFEIKIKTRSVLSYFFLKMPDLLCVQCPFPFPFYSITKFQVASSLKSALFIRFIY